MKKKDPAPCHARRREHWVEGDKREKEERGEKSEDGRKIGESGSMKGSYTVEAAVVVSVTILVLASLLLCIFFIHDRAVLQSMVCETALAGSGFATEAERKEAVSAASGQIRKGRFLGSRSLSGNVSAGEKEVTAAWSMEYPLPGFAARYFSGGSLRISRSWTSRIQDPADMIRKIKGAGELLTGGEK